MLCLRSDHPEAHPVVNNRQMNKEGPALRWALLFYTRVKFAAVTLLRVKKVGNIGERAINTIVVRYDMLDTLLALKERVSGGGARRP